MQYRFPNSRRLIEDIFNGLGALKMFRPAEDRLDYASILVPLPATSVNSPLEQHIPLTWKL